jgi:hypothetical protein
MVSQLSTVGPSRSCSPDPRKRPSSRNRFQGGEPQRRTSNLSPSRINVLCRRWRYTYVFFVSYAFPLSLLMAPIGMAFMTPRPQTGSFSCLSPPSLPLQDGPIPLKHKAQKAKNKEQTLTCGLIKTRSMKSTTKSCSTYLSQKRPQLRHTVRRIFELASPAPEYCVQRVRTGCRHSIQIGIVFSFVRGP